MACLAEALALALASLLLRHKSAAPTKAPAPQQAARSHVAILDPGSGLWPMLSPEAVAGDYACPA
eukprot:119136-Prymnesium_polylepis.1